MAKDFFKDFDTNMEIPDDRLPGLGGRLESDIYDGTITTAYLGESANGAQNVTLVVKLDNGREFRETIYITNRSGQNFYKDKNTGEKMPLPGFTTINDICLLATGEDLVSQRDSIKDKLVEVWDNSIKAMKKISAPMLTELLGAELKFAIQKRVENKRVKNDSTGEYEATSETTEKNYLVKSLRKEDSMTVSEILQEKEEALWAPAWLKSNQGVTQDKTVSVSASGSSSGSGNKSSGGGSKPVNPFSRKG